MSDQDDHPHQPSGRLVPALFAIAICLGLPFAAWGWASILTQGMMIAGATRVAGTASHLEKRTVRESNRTKHGKRGHTHMVHTIWTNGAFVVDGTDRVTEHALPDSGPVAYHGTDQALVADLRQRFAKGAAITVYIPDDDPGRAFVIPEIRRSRLWMAVLGTGLTAGALIALAHRRRPLRHPRLAWFAVLMAVPAIVAAWSFATTGAFPSTGDDTWIRLGIYVLVATILPAVGWRPNRAAAAPF